MAKLGPRGSACDPVGAAVGGRGRGCSGYRQLLRSLPHPVGPVRSATAKTLGFAAEPGARKNLPWGNLHPAPRGAALCCGNHFPGAEAHLALPGDGCGGSGLCAGDLGQAGGGAAARSPRAAAWAWAQPGEGDRGRASGGVHGEDR